MPSISRGRGAFAIVDSLLSERANDEGLNVSPGRVHAWRQAGLLPTPTERCTRPEGSPPGRSAMTYTNANFDLAGQIIRFLVSRSRRGRPVTDLALLQFAASLPVSYEVVVNALQAKFDEFRGTLASLIDEAPKQSEEISSDMVVSESYENAEALALLVMGRHAGNVREIRRQLRQEGQPAGRQDLISVLVNLFWTLLGDPPEPSDTDALRMLLYAFGGHGLTESLAPNVPAVLADGLAPFAEALGVLVDGNVLQLPGDIDESELHRALEFCQSLGAALAALPSEVRRYLGGEKVMRFWQPENADMVASLLVFTIKIRRTVPLDPCPLIGPSRAMEQDQALTG